MSNLLPENVLRYGRDESLPEEIPLQAGPLSMVFEPQNAFLRYICLDDREILRGVYAAVRDDVWGTVPPVLSNLDVSAKRDHFTLCFDVTCRSGKIDFAWKGRITGNRHGEVVFAMDGRGQLDIPGLLATLRNQGRDPNVILELWTPRQETLAATIALEDEWARASVAYMRQLLPDPGPAATK